MSQLLVPDPPPILIDALKENTAILWVGAGLSRLAGLPGWKDLLKKLAEFLPDSDLKKHILEDLKEKFPPYLEIAEKLKEELEKKSFIVGKALQVARSIGIPWKRAKALAEIAGEMAKGEKFDKAYSLIEQEIFPLAARLPRPKFWPVLSALTPAIAKLGGCEALEITYEAVQDVCRWWP